jgi:hypothetical protein
VSALRRRVNLGAIAVVVVIQAFRPSRSNPPMDVKQDISAVMTVDAAVRPILDRSCNDCHSNRTVWPWYSEIAPISWLVASDVSDARRHMNFSEWGTYPGYKREDLLNEMCKIVTERDMPLLTYVIAHREARLNDSDREAICRWTKANTEKK